MPILMDLTFASPTLWLGLPAGLDRARRLPTGSAPRTRKLGLIFGVAEGGLSVVLFGRTRQPADAAFAPSEPHPDLPWTFTSGTGAVTYVPDGDSAPAMGRCFVLSDLAVQTTVQLPATAPDATLAWEWYAQDAAVYRLLIWSPGLTD